jgi:hypothetical protein
MIRINNIVSGVKNLFYYIRVVWEDRDWDQYFLFVLLRHKLKKMEKHFKEEAYHVGAERDAAHMHTCVLLLDRLIEDSYTDTVWKKHEEKWGEMVLDWDNPDPRMRISREKVTPETVEQEREESLYLYGHEEYLKKQDIKHLFHLLEKYIQTWWD